MTATAPPETDTEITTEIPVVTEPAEQSEQSSPTAVKPEKPVIGAESAPITLAEYSKQGMARLRRHWTPPALWETGRPPLKSAWLWARYGEHLPDDEGARAPSRVTTVLRMPFKALALYLDWIFDRDSRVVAAAVLLVVIQVAFHPFF